MEAIVVLVALIALAVLALRYGAESRDGFGDGPGGRPDARVPVWWAEPSRDRVPAEAPATW